MTEKETDVLLQIERILEILTEECLDSLEMQIENAEEVLHESQLPADSTIRSIQTKLLTFVAMI